MTPYYLCYAVIIACFFGGLLLDRMRLAAIVAFAPMLFLIAARGWVGTDSAIYVQEIDIIRYQGVFSSSFEPGFAFLAKALTLIIDDSFDVMIIFGIVTALIMLGSGLLLERDPILFVGLVLPFFLLDMSMNGIRYGLSFAIVALGAFYLERSRTVIFALFAVAAASIQFTSVVLALGLWALVELRIRTFLLVAMGSMMALMFFNEHLDDKVNENVDLAGLGGFSGLIPLVVTLLLLAGLRASGRKSGQTTLAILGLGLLQIGTYFISRYYYAGLRLQTLFLFMTYLFAVISIKRSSLTFSTLQPIKIVVSVSLVLSTASRIKNFSDDTSGFSPFNPYYFSSELSA